MTQTLLSNKRTKVGSNNATAEVSDEQKARLIVQKMLLRMNVRYWKKYTPELAKLIESNKRNYEFLFPVIALENMMVSKDDEDFWDIARGTTRGYGFFNHDSFKYDIHIRAKYNLLMSLMKPRVGDPASYASSVVKLLEKSDSDLNEFSSEYESAERVAEFEMEEERSNKFFMPDWTNWKLECFFNSIKDAFYKNGHGSEKLEILYSLMKERTDSISKDMGDPSYGRRVQLVSMRMYSDVLAAESEKGNSDFVRMPIEWQWDMSVPLGEAEITEIVKRRPFSEI